MTATTQPETAGDHRLGAMLRGAFLPTALVVPVGVVVGALVAGGRGALGAGLGGLVALAFLAVGLLVMLRLAAATDALRFLASAMAVFLGQLVFLLVVILALQDATWLDGTAFGLAALAAALVWQVGQVVAFMRTRRLVFDAGTAARPDAVDAAAQPGQDGVSTP